MSIAHVRNWQFQNNQAIGTAAAGLTNDRLLAIGVVSSMLGRGSWLDKDGASVASSGNWTVTSSGNSSTVGNNDNVNNWDTAGVLDPAKLVWSTGAHSWIVLQQTGIAPKFQVCFDLNSNTTTQASVVVSFGAGFGLANGGANGTTTARPTATDQLILSTGSFGSGGVLGTIWHCQKTDTGSAWRFFANRSDLCAMVWGFEIPDPVVSGWTTPSVSHAVGNATAAEVCTFARFATAANVHGRTPGGTTFANFLTSDGSATHVRLPESQGNPVEIDNTITFREIGLQSTVTNARGVNGKLVDLYWASETGDPLTGTFNGQISPAGGPVQWVRQGVFWVPWPSGVANGPRISL